MRPVLDHRSYWLYRGMGMGVTSSLPPPPPPPGQVHRRPRTPSPCDSRIFSDLWNFVHLICIFFYYVRTVFLYINVLLHFLLLNFSSILVSFLCVFFMFIYQ